MRALPPQEQELVKAIFSALRAGATFIAFDNAKGEIESPALESALTSRYVSSRILGSHTEGIAKNRAVWVLLANNVSLSRDLIRRGVRNRIDAHTEKPEEGRNFKHPDLVHWVRANRGLLVHAVLTLIQNWVAKGRPKFSGVRRASFEAWSDTVGGILDAAGVKGFLDPAADMTSADPKRGEARDFVEAWYAAFQGKPMLARELLDELCARPVAGYQDRPDAPKDVAYLASVLGNGAVGSRSVRLGKWCSANVDRVFGELRIAAGPPNKNAGSARYTLVRVSAGSVSTTVATPETEVPPPLPLLDNVDFSRD
jgi:hypothetical protein